MVIGTCSRLGMERFGVCLGFLGTRASRQRSVLAAYMVEELNPPRPVESVESASARLPAGEVHFIVPMMPPAPSRYYSGDCIYECN